MFVCEVDLGRTVPETWSEVSDLLKQNFVTDMEIQAFANAFHQKVVICTVHGVSAQ